MDHAKNWQMAQKWLSKRDPVMAKLMKSYKGELLRSRGDSFVTLLRSIVGQQISVKAAATVWGRLEEALPNLTPANVIDAPMSLLRAAGLSARKVEYAKDLSQAFDSGRLKPHAWADMSDQEIIDVLCEVRGIGRWTAEMFLIFHLLRLDVFPVDDIGLKRAMSLAYKKRYPLSDKTLLHFSKLWTPYRSVATWYMWRSLDPIPVEY